MPKNLKLTGLKTYTNGVIGATPAKKGDIIRVDDNVAEIMLQGKRLNAERDEVPYWTETDEPAKVDYSTQPADVATKDPAPVAPVAAVVAASVGQRAGARRATATK